MSQHQLSVRVTPSASAAVNLFPTSTQPLELPPLQLFPFNYNVCQYDRLPASSSWARVLPSQSHSFHLQPQIYSNYPSSKIFELHLLYKLDPDMAVVELVWLSFLRWLVCRVLTMRRWRREEWLESKVTVEQFDDARKLAALALLTSFDVRPSLSNSLIVLQTFTFQDQNQSHQNDGHPKHGESTSKFSLQTKYVWSACSSIIWKD